MSSSETKTQSPTSPASKELAIFSQTYPIYGFLLNRQGRLGLYFLLNLLQETSMAHSLALGHGQAKTTEERNAFWVLTRQKLVMSRWPAWSEHLKIQTWVRPADGAFAVRDFELFVGEDKIGEATTSYLLLDGTTRKPKTKGADFLDFAARKEGHLKLEAVKIPVQHQNVQTLARFEVRNSDIDTNNHVNNTRYAQWILDAIPIEQHQVTLREYGVNFIAETKLGDVIEVQVLHTPSDPTTYFHGLRLRDQMIVFTAHLVRT